MEQLKVPAYYFILSSCLTLFLACSGQAVFADESQHYKLEGLQGSLLDFSTEDSAPWVSDLQALGSKTQKEVSLLSDLERLIETYPDHPGVFDSVAALYLLILPSSRLVSSKVLFSRLSSLGMPVPESIQVYLKILDQEERWLKETLQEYLEKRIEDLPEESAYPWFYEKLLVQKDILTEGILSLEEPPSEPLKHFLTALLKIRQPFLGWSEVDRYLSESQIEPEQTRLLKLYRALLKQKFAPLEKAQDIGSGRSFLGMKLFASAGEMPTIQEEVDRLLTRLKTIEDRHDDLRMQYAELEEHEKAALDLCEERFRLHDEQNNRCQEILRVNNQLINACNDEYDRNHATGIIECNKRNDLTAERNRIVSYRNRVKAERKNTLLEWWRRCIGWNYPCPNGQNRICYPFDVPNHGCWQWAVTEGLWLSEHGKWKDEYNIWQSEAGYWSRICDQRRNALNAWKVRCLGLESSASQQNAQCREAKSASQALLNDCQRQLSLISQQKSELKTEKAELVEEYEEHLQAKSNLRDRIEGLQAELESIQPLLQGHCRTEDCPKLGFPQAPLDDFAHTVGEVYLAMAGPGGKLKTLSSGLPKIIKDFLSSTKVGRVTKGRTELRISHGGFKKANSDFESFRPSDVKEIRTQYGNGKTGTLESGHSVTVRPGSSDGRPTLEIRNPENGRGIEVRYD